jgi:chemotaxis signal transduction protein
VSGVHVRVRIAGEQYALPIEGVLEAAELGEVTPVPGAPAVVLGVRNLRGQLITVVDLATLFGLEDDSSPERIVITEAGNRRAGLAVEAILDVEPVSEPVEAAECEYLRGSVLADGQLVGVVDLSAALDAVAGNRATR